MMRLAAQVAEAMGRLSGSCSRGAGGGGGDRGGGGAGPALPAAGALGGAAYDESALHVFLYEAQVGGGAMCAVGGACVRVCVASPSLEGRLVSTRCAGQPHARGGMRGSDELQLADWLTGSLAG